MTEEKNVIIIVCPQCSEKWRLEVNLTNPAIRMIIESSWFTCKKCSHRFKVEGNIENN